MSWVLVIFLIFCGVDCARFNVVDYGAVGDGKTLNTVAIQKAINDAAKTRYNTVYFPEGQFLTGPINLTSYTEFFVSSQATVLGVQNKDLFAILPPFPSYGVAREAGTINRYEPVIGGYNLTEISLTGGGRIDGQGSYWWDLFKAHQLIHTRPRLLEFQWCNNVTIDSLYVENSPFWTIHPIYCNNVHINNVTVRAPSNSPNTDGIDPDSSSNVLIENVDISTGDDLIAIKSGMNMSGILFGKPSENIIVRNSKFGVGHGLSIGSETSGGVRNVTFENIVIDGAVTGPKIKTSRGRGAIIQQVVFSKITVNNVQTGISIGMNYDNASPGNKTTTPIVRDIKFEHVQGTAKVAGELECLPESPCDVGIVLDDINITSTSGFKCVNITGTSTNVSPKSCVN